MKNKELGSMDEKTLQTVSITSVNGKMNKVKIKSHLDAMTCSSHTPKQKLGKKPHVWVQIHNNI